MKATFNDSVERTAAGPRDPAKRPWLVTVLAALGILVAVYLFSTGPVCRWLPATAERIYTPLNPLAGSTLTGPVVRRWLALWGVDPDRRHLLTLKTSPRGYGGTFSQGIGFMTPDGKFVPYTSEAVIPMLRDKAESWDAGAQERLALSLYEDRHGPATNRVEAYKWAAVAAAQGRTSAKYLVREFELFMTPEEVSQGRAAARALLDGRERRKN